MQVSVRHIPVVFHVGTMDAKNKGANYASSWEGDGLSVSVTPNIWDEIAKLGGAPVHQLACADAIFLDMTTVDADMWGAGTTYAMSKGLVDWAAVFVAREIDCETEQFRETCFATEAEAWEHLEMEVDQGFEDLVRSARRLTLTPAGAKRARFTGDALESAAGFIADDFAISFWAEDELRKHVPELVGCWWNERLDVDSLSAPRGVIFNDSLSRFDSSLADRTEVDDEDNIIELPDQFKIDPFVHQTAQFRFVTNCVSANGPDINDMIDSPASRDINYDEFVKLLGQGSSKSGLALLHQNFPEYENGALSLKKDHHVSYHVSTFKGLPALYLVHSGIEYVYQKSSFLGDGFQCADPYLAGEEISSLSF
ncbi:hypothetical protein [Thalassospira xiamenensis]|uniref:Uncharacterized protein n=1 Tax=Thalassospira xiamenensis TaxID=220697 RepID=A0A285TXK4_9PROT|nr:hypothetical protein [Thalassospira xiamenensis]SOC30569.1 hypothetical protein SAMN05428964_109117 [Thalassospira xiamenensis]